MKSKKNNPIHGVKSKGLLDKKWFVELFSAGPVVVGGIVAALKAFDESKNPLIWQILFAICFWLLAGSIIKIISAHRQDKKDDDLRSHDGLMAAMHVVHEMAARAGNLSAADKSKCLRATFHRVLPPLGESDHIEQIIDYVGGDANGVGRTFPIRSGITGAAIREDEVYVMERESESFDDYKRELIRDWHYTEKDARNATSDRYSAMAVPVKSKDGQTVLGVVYLDSNQKDFFSPQPVTDAVINGCAGITQYIGERYV